MCNKKITLDDLDYCNLKLNIFGKYIVISEEDEKYLLKDFLEKKDDILNRKSFKEAFYFAKKKKYQKLIRSEELNVETNDDEYVFGIRDRGGVHCIEEFKNIEDAHQAVFAEFIDIYNHKVNVEKSIYHQAFRWIKNLFHPN